MDLTLSNIANGRYKECVVLNGSVEICPHEKIDGKTCSACKYPDIYLQSVKLIMKENALDKKKGL